MTKKIKLGKLKQAVALRLWTAIVKRYHKTSEWYILCSPNCLKCFNIEVAIEVVFGREKQR